MLYSVADWICERLTTFCDFLRRAVVLSRSMLYDSLVAREDTHIVSLEQHLPVHTEP